MNQLFAELRHTLRTLRRQPTYTIVAVFTLALGIGATTAIYSVVQGVLLSGMPYPEADRIVAATAEKPKEDISGVTFRVAEWQAFYDNIMNHTEPKTSAADFRKDLELFQEMIRLMKEAIMVQ